MALVSKSKSVSFVGPFPLHPLQPHVLYSRFKEVQLSLALLPKLVALKDIYDIDKAVGSITPTKQSELNLSYQRPCQAEITTPRLWRYKCL